LGAYPNIPITLEVPDESFNAEKLVYSTSRLYTISDIVFNTMDNFEFVNAVIYDGELVDIKMGNQSELSAVEFFIYDTQAKQRVVQKIASFEQLNAIVTK